MTIVTYPSDTAVWYDIVHEAEKSCTTMLQQELESYLVFLLIRYTRRADLAAQVMATAFLKGLHAPPMQRIEALRTVGDQCLLLSGLYPKVAQKRHVRIGYFVGLGRSAYSASSSIHNDLYAQLGAQFVAMMDILQSIRKTDSAYPDLMPLEAWELWSETGSRRAFEMMSQYTDATPVLIHESKKG